MSLFSQQASKEWHGNSLFRLRTVCLANIDETHHHPENMLNVGTFIVERTMTPGCRSDVDKIMEQTFMTYVMSRGGNDGADVELTGITRNDTSY